MANSGYAWVSELGEYDSKVLSSVTGPKFYERDEETVVPKLVSQASGIVLELGPGMGSQLPRYDVSKLTKVYGVEPNGELHGALRSKIAECGLEDIYEIVPCGIEDVTRLKKHGISLGSIDTILSMQVLCSVPDPDEILRRLYALLKPGGRFIIYEHVKSRDLLSMVVQSRLYVSFSALEIPKKAQLLISLEQTFIILSGLFSSATVISTATLSSRSCKQGIGTRSSYPCPRRMMHGWCFHEYPAT